MKKALLTTLVILAVVYFRHLPSALFLPRVKGVKFYSPFVSAEYSNGLSWVYFESPVFTLQSGGSGEWEKCQTLEENIRQISKNAAGWDGTGPYYVLKEKAPNAYYAYIKKDKEVLFLKGFPDFGGIGPSEAEKNVCADEQKVP